MSPPEEGVVPVEDHNEIGDLREWLSVTLGGVTNSNLLPSSLSPPSSCCQSLVIFSWRSYMPLC
jgi:hypothetical protein